MVALSDVTSQRKDFEGVSVDESVDGQEVGNMRVNTSIMNAAAAVTFFNVNSNASNRPRNIKPEYLQYPRQRCGGKDFILSFTQAYIVIRRGNGVNDMYPRDLRKL